MPNHILWAQRWRVARRMFKKINQPSQGRVDLAMLNYATYLTEVFSWHMTNQLAKEKL